MLAQSLPTPFDFAQPAGQVVAIVLFLIPGLNATWMIERLAGRTSLSPTERLFRAVSLSVLIYAFASPWLLRIGRRLLSDSPMWPWEPIGGFFLLLFVVPLLLGVGWARFRRSPRARAGVARLTNIDPSPTSWDYVFGRGGPYLVRARLRGGERVGGLFGSNSNASLYPETQDVYLEETWALDAEGRFLEPTENSKGILLQRADIEILELEDVRILEEGNDGR